MTSTTKIKVFREFQYDKPTPVVMTITPELARRMKETSPGNRFIRPKHVKNAAASIQRGEWRVTSQGIGFDIYGRVLDGHHRLDAVIESGVPIETIVIFGLRPDAYEVTDIGIARTYADRLNEDKRIADTLTLGCRLALGIAKPSIDQMHPIINNDFRDCAAELIQSCGSIVKYFSSAPIKLAAVTSILNGQSKEFVHTQYRALCTLDFDAMTPSGHALVRQVNTGMARANDSRIALARGLRVFDQKRAGVTKIQVSEADINAAVAFVRAVLLNPKKPGNRFATTSKASWGML